MNKVHDSDCATNNTGSPELLGKCDCSKGDGLSPRMLGLFEKFEAAAIKLAHTPKARKNHLDVDSKFRGAKADLLNAIKHWCQR